MERVLLKESKVKYVYVEDICRESLKEFLQATAKGNRNENFVGMQGSSSSGRRISRWSCVENGEGMRTYYPQLRLGLYKLRSYLKRALHQEVKAKAILDDVSKERLESN